MNLKTIILLMITVLGLLVGVFFLGKQMNKPPIDPQIEINRIDSSFHALQIKFDSFRHEQLNNYKRIEKDYKLLKNAYETYENITVIHDYDSLTQSLSRTANTPPR